MFNRTQSVIDTISVIINARISEINNRIDVCCDSVDCEICGCMVRTHKAIKGKSIIESGYRGAMGSRPVPYPGHTVSGTSGYTPKPVEYIRQVWYCKRCTPGELTEKVEGETGSGYAGT